MYDSIVPVNVLQTVIPSGFSGAELSGKSLCLSAGSRRVSHRFTPLTIADE